MMMIERRSLITIALWKTAGWAVLALIAASVAVLWSWNTLAGDLFALPEMQFRHAFALVLLIGILGTVFSFASRRRGHAA
jgi:hypothetical protein